MQRENNSVYHVVMQDNMFDHYKKGDLKDRTKE